MFIEFWWKCLCPVCKVANWVYDSHSNQSYSSNDMLALKCWSCGACNWMHEEAQEEAKSSHGVGYTEKTYLEDYGDLDGFDPTAKIEDVATLGKEMP